MKMPFTIEEFLEIFRQYNMEVWPVQIFIIVMAVTVVLLAFKSTPFTNRVICAILGFFWLWMGIVYHIVYFSKINDAALIFGGLFIIQSLLFFYYGTIKNSLAFHVKMNVYGMSGFILISFSLVIYPLLGYFAGQRYPSSPTFGLPCPTTIFTFGMLLFTVNRISIQLLFIPFLWSLIGFSAAFKLGIWQDISLLIAGIAAMFLIAMLNRSLKYGKAQHM